MQIDLVLIDKVIELSKDVFEIMKDINNVHKQEQNENIRIITGKETLTEEELEFLLLDNDIDSSRNKLYEYIGELKHEEKKLLLILSWLGRIDHSINEIDKLKINAENFLNGTNENGIKRYICYSELFKTIPEAIKKLNNKNEL